MENQPTQTRTLLCLLLVGALVVLAMPVQASDTDGADGGDGEILSLPEDDDCPWVVLYNQWPVVDVNPECL